jgi:hypothetical protein
LPLTFLYICGYLVTQECRSFALSYGSPNVLTSFESFHITFSVTSASYPKSLLAEVGNTMGEGQESKGISQLAIYHNLELWGPILCTTE